MLAAEEDEQETFMFPDFAFTGTAAERLSPVREVMTALVLPPNTGVESVEKIRYSFHLVQRHSGTCIEYRNFDFSQYFSES